MLSLYRIEDGAFLDFVGSTLFVQAGEDTSPAPAGVDPATWDWDTTTHGWTCNVDRLRARRWAEAQAVREARAVGGCDTPFGRVQTDEKSRGLLNGAINGAREAFAQGLADPATWTIVWRLADNDFTDPLSIDQIALIGVTAALHVSACYGASWQIEAALNAAATPEEIAAVDILAGYP